MGSAVSVLDMWRNQERRALWRQLEENDSATLERHCERWESKQGGMVSVPTMWRAVRKLGWTKKRGRWEPPNDMKSTEVLGENAGGFSIRARKS